MKLHKTLCWLLLVALVLGTLPALAQEKGKALPRQSVDSDVAVEARQVGPSALWPGPDGFGYSGQMPAFNWVDITQTGTPIVGLTDDNFVGPLPIGFTFSFYGANWTEFYAGSNGFLSFGAGSTALTNQCPLPNGTAPDNLIALLWDDLNFNTSGNAYYQTFDPCPVGAGPCLVVEYYNVAHYGGAAGSAGTWEAILYANTGNVLIQFLDPGVEFGSGSTTGIEGNNAPANYGLTYACDTANSLTPNLAVEFLFPSGLMLSPDAAAKQGCEDSDVTYTLTLSNYTGADGTFNMTYGGTWPIYGPPAIFAANMDSVPFNVTVHIPCGGVSDVATVTASGNGYSDTSTLTTSSTPGGFLAWEAIAPINGPGRSRPAAAGVDGKVYLLGGEISGGRANTVDEYDPAANTWTVQAGLMPVPASNVCAAAIGTDIYIPGGYDASGAYLSTLQVYHVDTDTWETVTTDPLPGPRAGPGCAALGGKLYAFGGTDGTYRNTAWVYDPAAPAGSRWTSLPNMAYARAYLAGTAVNGKVYAVGGRDSATSDFNYVEAFDPADGLWHTVTPLTYARGGPGAMHWMDNLVVCGGGWSTYRNTCEVYDTTQGYGGVWTTLSQTMITGRRTFGYASLPDALYAVAGYNGTFLTSAERLPAFLCEPCEQYPDIEVTPESLYAEQCPDEITEQTLTICNTGDALLNWSLSEQPVAEGRRAVPTVALPEGAPPSLLAAMAAGLSGPVAQPVPAAPAVAPEALTFYSDRPTFDGDFPGLPVEGYENGSMAPGTVDAIPHPLDQYSSNAYFDPGDILPGIQFWATQTHSGDEIAVLGANFLGNPTKTAVANWFVDSYRIVFNPPVQAAGMDLQEYLGSYACQVDIYAPSGALMGSVTSGCNEAGVFWGVASDADPIAEIVITSLGGGAEGADNIAFGATPPPPDPVPWLFENPTSGTVPAGQCQDVTVGFDSAGMAPGDYYANLHIDSNDPDEPTVVVPVQMRVLECAGIELHINRNRIFRHPGAPGVVKVVTQWQVYDQNNAPVEGAVIAGEWTLPDGSVVPGVPVLGLTDYLGRDKFQLKDYQAGLYQFCVTGITKAGYWWDPADPLKCLDIVILP